MSAFFVLSKILHFLTTPIVWIFALALWGLLSRNQGKRRLRLWASVLLLYFFSNSFFYEEFARPYETELGIAADLESDYDVVMVLGGYSQYIEDYDQFDLFESSDRLFQGLRLYNMGKAKKILLVGGTGRLVDRDNRESTHAKDFLVQMGVHEEDILVEAESNNSHENAVRAMEILRTHDFQKSILVTSASHMPRSIACFNKLGLHPTPFSVDATAGPRRAQLDYLFIPNSNVLESWNALVHEWVGYAVYFIIGYV